MKTAIGLFVVICLLLCCGGGADQKTVEAQPNDGWVLIGHKRTEHGECKLYFQVFKPRTGQIDHLYWSVCTGTHGQGNSSISTQ